VIAATFAQAYARDRADVPRQSERQPCKRIPTQTDRGIRQTGMARQHILPTVKSEAAVAQAQVRERALAEVSLGSLDICCDSQWRRKCRSADWEKGEVVSFT